MITPDPELHCKVVEAVNFNDRRCDVIDMLVLHYTGMASAEKAVEWLCVEESQVSCHYLVDERGTIVQMVPEAKRAWHAGVSTWRGSTDVNSRSIGIEIANPGHELGYRRFPDRQMDAVIALCRDILGRNPIPARNVVAHSDIAPQRKRDPGEKFPWRRLAREGVGLFVEPSRRRKGLPLSRGDEGEAVRAFQEGLVQYGFGLEPSGHFDPATEAVTTAFQRHFRPARITGSADPSTVETLSRLLLKSSKS